MEMIINSACKRALEVDKQCRLYTQVVDVTAIKAARVEAMLCKVLPDSSVKRDVMSAFYIELNVVS